MNRFPFPSLSIYNLIFMKPVENEINYNYYMSEVCSPYRSAVIGASCN